MLMGMRDLNGEMFSTTGHQTPSSMLASCGASRAATDTSRRIRQLAPRGIRQLAPSTAKGKRQTACAIVQSTDSKLWSLSSDDEDDTDPTARAAAFGALKGGMPVSSSKTTAYAVIHTQAIAGASRGVPGGKD